MRKRYHIRMAFLVVLLLLLQVISPLSMVLATTVNTMLPPNNLSLQFLTPDQVRLTWGAVNGATGYNVYGIAEGQLIRLGTSTTNSYTISGLSEGMYSYVVSTLSSLGESGPSAPVSATIEYPEMLAPSLTSLLRNGNDIVLNWTASQYAQAYNIYQIDRDGNRTLINSTALRTLTVTNVEEGNYQYGVTSVNPLYGESSLSNVVNETVVHPVMVTPENFTFTVAANNDVTLKWNSVANATNYKIYEIVNGEKILKSTVTGTNVIYSNMLAGEYTFEVYSFSTRFGESANGSQVTLTVGSVVMTAPDNFNFKIQNINDVVLSWNAVPNANNYKIYEILNGEKVLRSTVTGTTVTYTNLPAGEYTYVVHSNSTRFGESEIGNQLNLSVDSYEMTAPENLNYRLQNGNDIVLSWNATTNATNYRIYLIVNNQKVLRSTITGTTVTYANVAEGNYEYQVYSFSNRFGESAEGSPVALSVVYPKMQTPTNIVYTIKSGTDFTISWSAVEYATSYKVYEIVNGQRVLRNTVTTTFVNFTKMPPGSYVYEVEAVSNRFGESTGGNRITVIVSDQVMETPTNLTVSTANVNDVTLRWNSVLNASKYNVYQIVNGERVLKSGVTGTTVTYSNHPEGEYHYEVYSFSTLYGESPVAAKASFSIVFPKLLAPSNFDYRVQNGNDVVLTWAKSDNANRYLVYELINGQKVLVASPTALTVTLSNVTEGEHTYIIHSSSTRFGDSEEGNEVSLTMVFPTMQAPSNFTHSISNGNDVTLRWNATTFANNYRVYQIVDGQKILRSTITGTQVTFTNMAEGNYQYVVHSFSSRFGESPVASEINFTIAHPTMQAPAGFTQSITGGNDIVLKWNVATHANNYRVYQIVDGQKVLRSTVTGTQVNFTNMAEGNYQYVVHSFSTRFGESPVGSQLSFNLVWPVVQPPVISRTIINVNNITLSWSAITWADEYRVYKVGQNSRELLYKGKLLNYPIYNLTEDTHSFEVTAFSTRFGESVVSNRISETIVYPEMQSPVATIKLLSEDSAQIIWNFVTYANGYNVYHIVDGEPVLLIKNLNNLSYIVNNLSYADHEFYVTSFSNSFGESKPSNLVLAKLIVDTEPPVTTANVPSDWTKEGLTISLSVTDNLTGVADTYYSVNGGDFVKGTTFTVSGEGINKIAYYSVDKVGNVETVKESEVKIDKTAPITTIDVDNNWKTENVEVNLSAIDTLSGVAKIYYSINGSDYKEGTTFTVEQEGINQVSFYSVDNSGNVEKVKEAEVKIDKTAPITTIDVDSNWKTENVEVNLSAIDTLSGVAKIYYSINGSDYKEGTTFTVEQEGINQVSFYSVDNAGNIEKVQEVEIKIDKTAPKLSLDLDEEYEVGTIIKLNYITNDELSGVKSEQMKVIYPDETVKVVENLSELLLDQVGVYHIIVTVTDNAGLQTEIKKQIIVNEINITDIVATIEVTPKVIKGNKGVFTVRVTLPEGFGTETIDLNTVTLNGVSALTSNNGYYNQAKIGQFKFERSHFTWDKPEVLVEFRGYINGRLVVGQTTVKVQK